MKIELSIQALLAVICLLWLLAGGAADWQPVVLAVLMVVLLGRA